LPSTSVDLAKVGRRDEALAASEAAVSVRHRLAAANPAAYEPDLASSLNNLSVRLGHVGRGDEAEQTRAEAVISKHASLGEERVLTLSPLRGIAPDLSFH